MASGSGYLQQCRSTQSGYPTLPLRNDSGHLGVRAPVGAETAEFVPEQYRLMPRFGARTLLLDGEAAATERADGGAAICSPTDLVARRRSPGERPNGVPLARYQEAARGVRATSSDARRPDAGARRSPMRASDLPPLYRLVAFDDRISAFLSG